MASSRRGFAAVMVAGLVLGCASPVLAQDKRNNTVHHRCPSCGTELPQKRCGTCGATLGQVDDEEIDRRLDESLRREYGSPDGTIPPPPPEDDHEHRDHRDKPEKPKKPKKHHDDDDDDDRFRISLGVWGGHWQAELFQASVTNYRKHWFGPGMNAGGRIRLDGHEGSPDLDVAQTQTYQGWIDLGKHVTISGGARYATYRDTAGAPPLSFFGAHYFTSQQPLMTKFEFLSSDLDVTVNPLAFERVKLGVMLGLRYVRSAVRFSTNQNFAGPDDRVSQSVEALIPMVGLGGSVRPINAKKVSVELYAQGMVGGFDLETRSYNSRSRARGRNGNRYYYYSSNGNTYDDHREFRSFALVAEGGIKVVLFGHLGVVAGYRFEVTQLYREDESRIRQAAFKVGGPYAGAVVEF
jgi:hypothetical protein